MNVSVVITCHNEEAYIKQCVNSVIAQSDYQDIKERLKSQTPPLRLQHCRQDIVNDVIMTLR